MARRPYRFVPVVIHDPKAYTAGQKVGKVLFNKPMMFLYKLALVITFLAIGWDAVAIIVMVAWFMSTGARISFRFRGRGVGMRVKMPQKKSNPVNANAPYGA